MPESVEEQNLAQALSDVSATLGDTPAEPGALTFEEAQPGVGAVASPFGDDTTATADANAASADTTDPTAIVMPSLDQPLDNTPTTLPVPDPSPLASFTSSDTPAPSAPSSPLDSIKTEALAELRPLVDKLNVAPDEKFDTYLLLLRSTDDTALIAPAYEAAKAITDEAHRAQALLDIIKEIDFLSQPKKDA